MTRRDKEILDYIKSYMVENGTVPTMREIGEGVCLYSTTSVYKHMQNLIRLGEIIPVKEKSYRYIVKGMKYVRDET
jgi:repressor LexA